MQAIRVLLAADFLNCIAAPHLIDLSVRTDSIFGPGKVLLSLLLFFFCYLLTRNCECLIIDLCFSLKKLIFECLRFWQISWFRGDFQMFLDWFERNNGGNQHRYFRWILFVHRGSSCFDQFVLTLGSPPEKGGKKKTLVPIWVSGPRLSGLGQTKKKKPGINPGQPARKGREKKTLVPI